MDTLLHSKKPIIVLSLVLSIIASTSSAYSYGVPYSYGAFLNNNNPSSGFSTASTATSTATATSPNNPSDSSYSWAGTTPNQLPVITIPTDKAKNFAFSFDSNAKSDLVIGFYCSTYTVPAGQLNPNQAAFGATDNSLGAVIELRLGLSVGSDGAQIAYDMTINNTTYTMTSLGSGNPTPSPLYKLPTPQNNDGTTTYFVSLDLDAAEKQIHITVEYLNTTTGLRELLIRASNDNIREDAFFTRNKLAAGTFPGFDKVSFRTINGTTYNISNISAISTQNVVNAKVYPWGFMPSNNYKIDIDPAFAKSFSATFTANPEHDFVIGLYSSNYNTGMASGQGKPGLYCSSVTNGGVSSSLGAIIEFLIGGADGQNGGPKEAPDGTNGDQSIAIRYEACNHPEGWCTGWSGFQRGATPFTTNTNPASPSTTLRIPGKRGSNITYTLTATLSQSPNPSLSISLSYLDPKTKIPTLLVMLSDQNSANGNPRTGTIDNIATALWNYLKNPDFTGFTAIGFRTSNLTSFIVRDATFTLPQDMATAVTTNAVNDVSLPGIAALINGAVGAVNNLSIYSISQGTISIQNTQTSVTQNSLSTILNDLQNNNSYSPNVLIALANAQKAISPQTSTSYITAATCSINAAINAYNAALTWAECLDLQAQKIGTTTLQSDPNTGTQNLLSFILTQASNIPTTRPTATTYTSLSNAQTAQTMAEKLLTAFCITKQANGSTLLQNLQAADTLIASSMQTSNLLTMAISNVTNSSIPTLITGATTATSLLQTSGITSGTISLSGTPTPLTQATLASTIAALQNDSTIGIAALTTAVKAATTVAAAASYSVNAAISAYTAALAWAECLDLQAQKIGAKTLQNNPDTGTQVLLDRIFEQRTALPTTRPTPTTYTTVADARAAQTKAEAFLSFLLTTKQPNGSTSLQNLQAADTAVSNAIQASSFLSAAVANTTNTNIPTLIAGAKAATDSLQTNNITGGSVTLNGTATPLTQASLASVAATLQNDSTIGIAALTTAVKAATTVAAAASYSVNAAISAYTAALTWAECLDLQAQKIGAKTLQNNPDTGTQVLLDRIFEQRTALPTTRPTPTTYTTVADARAAQTKAEAFLSFLLTTKQPNGSTSLQNLQAADTAVSNAIQASSFLSAAVANTTNTNIPTLIAGAKAATDSLQTNNITGGSVTLNGTATPLTQASLASVAATLQNDSTIGIAALTTAVKAATTVAAAASYSVNAAISAYTAALTWAECLDLQAQKIGTTTLQSDPNTGTQTLLGLILAQMKTLPSTRPTPTTYTATSDAQAAQTKAESVLTALFTTKQSNNATILQNLQTANENILTSIQGSTASSGVASDLTAADVCISNALAAVGALATAGITTATSTINGTAILLTPAAVSDLQTNALYGTTKLKNLAQQLSITGGISTVTNAALCTVNAAMNAYTALLTWAACTDLIAQKVIGDASDKSLQTDSKTGTQSIINAITALAPTIPATRPTTYATTSDAQTAQTAAHTLLDTLSGRITTNLMAAINAIANQAIKNATTTLNKTLPDATTADTNAQAAITAANNLPSTVGNKADLIKQANALQNSPGTNGATAPGTGPNLTYINTALKALPTSTQTYTTVKDAFTMCANAIVAISTSNNIASTNTATINAIAALQSAINTATQSKSAQAPTTSVAQKSPLDSLNEKLTTEKTAVVNFLTSAQTQATAAIETLKTIAGKATGSSRTSASSLLSSIGDLLNKINNTLSAVSKENPPFKDQKSALKAKATIESAAAYAKQAIATLTARNSTITNLKATVSA